jgi:hypothetical protein
MSVEDVFRARVDFQIEDDADVWAVTEHLVNHLARLLDQFNGYVQADELRLSDLEDSKIHRPTIESLRNAVRENYLVPAKIHQGFKFKRGVKPPPPDADDSARITFEYEVGMRPDLEVDIWSRFSTDYFSKSSVYVNLESPDKILVDGLKARLVAESERLSTEGVLDVVGAPSVTPLPVTPSPVRTSPNNVFHGPVNVGVIGDGGSVGPIGIMGEPHKPTDGAFPEVRRSWLVRTWQDHTASFVITVVSGIIVAAVAAWLGIQAP